MAWPAAVLGDLHLAFLVGVFILGFRVGHLGKDVAENGCLKAQLMAHRQGCRSLRPPPLNRI